MSQSSFLHKLSLISQNMFWSSSLLSDKALKNNNRIQIFLFLSAFLFFCLDSLLFLQTYRTARNLWKRKLFTNFFMKTIEKNEFFLCQESNTKANILIGITFSQPVTERTSIQELRYRVQLCRDFHTVLAKVSQFEYLIFLFLFFSWDWPGL